MNQVPRLPLMDFLPNEDKDQLATLNRSWNTSQKNLETTTHCAVEMCPFHCNFPSQGPSDSYFCASHFWEWIEKSLIALTTLILKDDTTGSAVWQLSVGQLQISWNRNPDQIIRVINPYHNDGVRQFFNFDPQNARLELTNHVKWASDESLNQTQGLCQAQIGVSAGVNSIDALMVRANANNFHSVAWLLNFQNVNCQDPAAVQRQLEEKEKQAAAYQRQRLAENANSDPFYRKRTAEETGHLENMEANLQARKNRAVGGPFFNNTTRAEVNTFKDELTRERGLP